MAISLGILTQHFQLPTPTSRDVSYQSIQPSGELRQPRSPKPWHCAACFWSQLVLGRPMAPVQVSAPKQCLGSLGKWLESAGVGWSWSSTGYHMHLICMPYLFHVSIPCVCHIFHAGISSVFHVYVILTFDIISQYIYIYACKAQCMYIYIIYHTIMSHMCNYMCIYIYTYHILYYIYIIYYNIIYIWYIYTYNSVYDILLYILYYLIYYYILYIIYYIISYYIIVYKY